jgi:hypothetical protein
VAVETSADLLGQLRDEIGFDVQGGDATLLGWLNARHRRMVAKSKCYRQRTVISGGTVQGQGDYLLPSAVLEVQTVEVGGARFDRVSRSDVIDVRNAEAVFVSPHDEGVVAQGANGMAGEILTIFPAPDTAGTEVAVFGPVRAPELTVSGVGGSSSTNSPVVPAEYFEALVHGAAAIGLRRTESRVGEAQAYDQEFIDATEDLRRYVRRRWNTGPSRIRVSWPQ